MKVTIDRPVTDKLLQPKFDEIAKILDNQHKLDELQIEWNLEVARAILELDRERCEAVQEVQQQITKVFAIYAGVLAVVAILLSIAIYIK